LKTSTERKEQGRVRARMAMVGKTVGANIMLDHRTAHFLGRKAEGGGKDVTFTSSQMARVIRAESIGCRGNIKKEVLRT